MAAMGRLCSVPDCLELAKDGTGLCWAHKRRRTTGRPMAEPVKKRQTIDAHVLEAVLDVAHADSEPDCDSDFHRAWERLRYIAARWTGASAADLHRRRPKRKRVLEDA